jgi:kynurenine formamidase
MGSEARKLTIALRSIVLAASVLLGACSGPAPTFPRGEIVDLSHAFDEETVFWPTAEEFRLDVVFQGDTGKGYYYSANRFSMAEHGGTHIDAPIHFHREGLTLDAIPVDQLIGPGIVVDVSDACAADRDYLATREDLAGWEARHGRIPEDAIVLLRTGFGRFWPDRARYMGTDGRGEDAVADLHFPGLHPEAARWLATERSVGALGIDTPSIDHGPSTTFGAHVALFAENVPVLENVANLASLPESGFTVIALPMKIRGGSGGPVRAVAMVP